MIACDFCKKDITQEGRDTIPDAAEDREWDACTDCQQRWLDQLHDIEIHNRKYEKEQKAKWIKNNLVRE